ncbi:MAG: hypothetical protein AAF638_12190 [Pseudomonadota bacterium]
MAEYVVVSSIKDLRQAMSVGFRRIGVNHVWSLAGMDEALHMVRNKDVRLLFATTTFYGGTALELALQVKAMKQEEESEMAAANESGAFAGDLSEILGLGTPAKESSLTTINTSVVVIAENPTKQYVLQCKEAGVSGIFRIPDSFEEFVERLRQFVER